MNIVTTVIDWDGLKVDPLIVAENIDRVPGRFIPTDVVEDGPCAVVGFGPSLKDTWEEIREFKTILTCSGAHAFLVEHGIVPTYHVDSEPRPHKVALLGEPNQQTIYMPASVCARNYFDKLIEANAQIKMWHVFFDGDDYWNMIPSGEWLICGGSTIGPRTLKIAHLLGFRDVHCFGLDGSGKHAAVHNNEPPDWKYNTVVVHGKEFHITEHMWYQTKLLFDDIDRTPETKVTFHGDGLIQELARTRKPRTDLGRTPLAIQKA